MPFDPNGLLEAISAGLARVPPGLIAAGLLAGPTVIWLILRFAHPPDPGKREVVVPEISLWLCESCRSLNNAWRDRCYHCHRPADARDAPLIFEGPATMDPGVGIAVGPGLAIGDERPFRPWTAVPHGSDGDRVAARVDEDAGIGPPDEVGTDPWLEVDEPAIPATATPHARAVEEPPSDDQPIEPLVFEPWVKVSGRPSAPRPTPPRRR
jgi:hypothetical protein